MAAIEASSGLDDFLKLCPSPHTVQRLLASDQHTTEDKAQSLEKVVLRCASSGDVHLLAWILEAKSYVSQQQSAQGPPGSQALAALRLDELRDEDGEGGDSSSEAPFMGPLCLAASSGHIDVVKLLLDYGVPIDEQDGLGWTPLMWAVNSSNLPLVDYLIRRGANVEARSHKGTTCEDFIVSIAPEEVSQPSMYHYAPRAAPAAGPSSPRSRDRQLIADAIFDRLQTVAAYNEADQSIDNFSVAPSPSGGRTPSTPSRSHNRAVSIDSTPAATPPKARGHSRTLTHQSPMMFAPTSSTSRRLIGKNERHQIQEANLRTREVAEGRGRALLDMSVLLDVDFSSLVGEPPREDDDHSSSSWAIKRRSSKQRRRNLHQPNSAAQRRRNDLGLLPGCGALEVGADPLSVGFDFEQILPDQMMVFGDGDIDPLLDMIVSHAKPVRAPWIARAEPANAVFLCLRYAASLGDEDLLINMLYATLETVEDVSRAREGDVVSQAFWLFNMMLLLYYTRRDVTLSQLPKMREEAHLFIQDLVNEIVVAIIRDVERRISKVLEVALLEHEAIPGFEDVRFEGEWNLIKTLKGSVRASTGGGGTNSLRHKGSARRPLSQIFSQFKEGSEENEARAGPMMMSPMTGGSSMRGESYAVSGRPPPQPGAALGSSTDSKLSAAEQLSHPTPRTVTSILTAALHVLQLYEINPAVIVQIFSQVFYWLGSELFNRVRTSKKYLCRSRAMQLKLNVSTLEDWARSNALPLGIVTTHLAPVNQLISWLSCHSTLRDFPALIATLQGLHALTPMQMRRAVRDYRYEVGEPRMSEECRQYLDQLVGDWQRSVEVQREAEEEGRARRELERMRREILREDAKAAQREAGNGEEESIERHHRSGTTTERGVNPDSRSPTPPPKDDLGADTSGSTVHMSSSPRIMGRASSLGLDLGSNASPHNFNSAGHMAGPQPPSKDGIPSPADSESSLALRDRERDEEASRAQSLVDSLFLPGRSIADFVPSRTTLGSSATTTAPIRELFKSSAMLPFALPSSTEALIVSPGDAFGFGRGHFAGTGTPSLRHVRGNAGTLAVGAHGTPGGSGPGSMTSTRDFLQVPGTPGSSISATRRASIVASSPTPGSAAQPEDIDDALSESSAGGPSATSTSSATSSTLFATGRGFAAGGYWQPVPLLRDETFEALGVMMRKEAEKQWIALARQRRAALASLREEGLALPEQRRGSGMSARSPSGQIDRRVSGSRRRVSEQSETGARSASAITGDDSVVINNNRPSLDASAESSPHPQHAGSPLLLDVPHYTTRPTALQAQHGQLRRQPSFTGSSGSLGSESDDESYGEVRPPSSAPRQEQEGERPRSTSPRKQLLALGGALARKAADRLGGPPPTPGSGDPDSVGEPGRRLRKAASRLFEQSLTPADEEQRHRDALLAQAKRKASGFSSRAGPLNLPAASASGQRGWVGEIDE